MQVSVICVYNNKQQLEHQLIASLNKQKIDFELITIDNVEKTFPSAAKALNVGAIKANGDILVFAHQDICFKTSEELGKLCTIVNECPIGTIIGTQGVREPSKIYYTNLTSGYNYIPTIVNNFYDQLYEVSCVDEGLFAMKKETWEKHNFDEILCNDWHLYCVEACLNARKNGHKVYVLPIQIHHFSKGKINLSYMNGLIKIADKYRKNFKYIWTTCYKVRNNYFYVRVLRMAWILNRKIRRREL